MEQEKVVDTMTIKDEHNDEERSCVLSPQANISPIHVTTPDTLVGEQKKSLDANA